MNDQTTLADTDTTTQEHLPNPEADAFYSDGKETPAETEASETSVEESAPEDANVQKEAEPQAEADQKPEVAEDYSLQLADDTLLDKNDLNDLADFAKDKNLDKEVAQEIVQREEKAVQTYAERQQEFVTGESKQWRADFEGQFKTDVEVKEADLKISKALEGYAVDEFVELANKTGIVNHPSFRNTMLKIGSAMSDDTFESGGVKNSVEDKPLHDVFYDNTKE